MTEQEIVYDQWAKIVDLEKTKFINSQLAINEQIKTIMLAVYALAQAIGATNSPQMATPKAIYDWVQAIEAHAAHLKSNPGETPNWPSLEI